MEKIMFKSTYRLLAATAFSVLTLQPMTAAAQSEPFIGQIACAGFNFAPKGWALAEGQLLPIAQNTTLFSLLGTTFGGNGTTNFALPDLRGRMILGAGAGPSLTPRTLGEKGGAENVTLATANLPSHTHTFAPLGSTNDATSISPAGKVAASKARTTQHAEPTNTVAMQAGTTSATGGNVPVDKMPPFLTMNCFIALVGVYPPRQ
jgi:microcystin-dependent protein